MIRLEDLTDASGVVVAAGCSDEVHVTNFAYRLDEVRPGSLYVALPGVGDGPDRARIAVGCGAVAVLAESALSGLPTPTPLLLTDDGEKALRRWAHSVLSIWRPRAVYLLGRRPNPVLAGLVEAVLGARVRITRARPRATSAGRLELVGALAEMDRSAPVAVFDLGTAAAGAWGDQASLLAPEVAVVEWPDPAELAAGDSERFLAELEPVLRQAALVVGDADDERWAWVRERSRATLGFGQRSGALRYQAAPGCSQCGLLRFEHLTERGSTAVSLLNERLAAAAVAVGLQFGLGLEEAASALGGYDIATGNGHPSVFGRGATQTDECTVDQADGAVSGVGRSDEVACGRAAIVAHADRPTWIEVDARALAHNTRLIRETAGVPLMAVLKADAYGHGAVRLARVVLENGADAIAVACLSEACALRRAGVSAEILILGYTPLWQAADVVEQAVSCALYDWDMAKALSRAGRDLGRPAVVHVKVDTGLSRLGLEPEEVPDFLRRLRDLPGLEVRGVFTHFGSADAGDLSHARGQLARFRRLLADLEEAGLRPLVAHAANTAAAMRLPEARLDMVRAAIGLYGLSPSPEAPLPAGFRQTLAFKTTVAQVKWVGPGKRVGYGRAFETKEPVKVAVLPVGYGDGFRRTPRNWGQVLVGGQRCPILGNVCMDQTMVDVSAVPDVAAGDEVVLIGRQGDATISVDEVAANMGTIVYEVVAAIMARVPRVIR